jgi:hypothetical protein
MYEVLTHEAEKAIQIVKAVPADKRALAVKMAEIFAAGIAIGTELAEKKESGEKAE